MGVEKSGGERKLSAGQTRTGPAQLCRGLGRSGSLSTTGDARSSRSPLSRVSLRRIVSTFQYELLRMTVRFENNYQKIISLEFSSLNCSREFSIRTNLYFLLYIYLILKRLRIFFLIFIHNL